MSRKAWLPVAGGVILIGLIAWVVFRPAPQDGAEAAAGLTGNSVPSAGEIQKRTRRPVGDPSASQVIENALAGLEAAEDDASAEVLAKTAATWPKDELPGAVDALFSKAEERPAAEELGDALLRRWASLAPAEAAAWAESLPHGKARKNAIQQVALAWAESDFDEAWNWASALAGEASGDSAILSLVYELSRSDPQGAFEKSGVLPEGEGRSRLVEHAVANWASIAPQAALERVREIADPALRNSALGSLAISWAQADPHSAATLVADTMEPGPAQDRAVAAIVQRWAQQDPDAAAAWVETFPDGPQKDNARGHIAKQSPVPEEEGP